MAGDPPRERLIPLAVPCFGEREVEAVAEVVRSGWVSTAGPATAQLERAFAERLGAPHAVAVASGTVAIQLALLALGVRPGDAVLLPALTFVAPANAVRHVGAEPLLLDVDPVTGHLDPQAVVAFVREECERTPAGLVVRESGRRLGALLPVHLLGHGIDLRELVGVAGELGVPVLEDATEGLGATIGGLPLGRIGAAGCFSFNGNKLITSGGGGMVVTGSAELAERVRYLSLQAKEPGIEYVHGEVGFNARMPGLSAALGLAQLESLDRLLDAKRRIARTYRDGLADIPGIAPLLPAAGVDSAWWLFTVLVDEAAAGLGSRALLAALDGRGIQARPLWLPLPECAPFAGCARGGWEAASAFHRHGLSLPSSAGLDPADQARVLAAVREIVAGAAA